MSTAVVERPLLKTPPFSMESISLVDAESNGSVAAKAKRWKLSSMTKVGFIVAGGLVLGGMNVSGMFHEHDWRTLLCVVPQTLALVTIFATWFTAFLFGDV